MPERPLHIALITTYPPGTGTLNEYAYHFVRALREKPEVGMVTLLADELPDGQSYEVPDEPGLASVRALPCWRFGAWDNALRLLAAVRRVQPDVVLLNIQFASFGRGKIPGALGLMAPALLRAAGFPTIVLLHNIMETVDLYQAGFTQSRLMERVIRLFGHLATRMILAAHLVALTIPHYVEILTRRYGAQNVLLAPHGAFEDSAPPDFELPHGPLQILTFGKFGTYKRVELLVEAFRLLQQRGYDLELVIAGTDSPNAVGYLDGIRRQFAHVPGIRFTGYVPEQDVPGLFSAAAVVAFSYTSTTGSSGVLHQAGNYGKAVVLPKIGDLAALIEEEGFVGEYFEPDSVPGLAEAILRVVDDPQHRHALGMRNYMAAHGLPISEVVDWYLLHMQTVLDERAAARRHAEAPISTRRG